MDVGKVYSWNDQTELDFWKNDSSCNAIKGTDGSTFHPDIKKDETIHIFNRDLCRSLPLVYQKDVIDGNGILSYRFVNLNYICGYEEVCVTIMCSNDELIWLFTNRFRATRYMKVKRMGITEILRRIRLFFANKKKKL